MDLTLLFRAAIAAKKTQIRNSGGEIKNIEILKTRPRCTYIKKFKDLVQQVSQLRDFLLKHRRAYMNFSPASLGDVTEMSDFDRDKVDNEAQFIIKSCSQLISNYRREAYLIEDETHEVENRKAILDLIENYLKSVTKIYTEQKAVRVKLTIELQKMAKLSSEKEIKSPETKEKAVSEENKKIASKPPAIAQNSSSPDKLRYSTFAAANELEENPLSEEELQMFERENEQLYNELNSLNEEVKEIQSKVIKIAELQEVFTEKVLEQSDEIERISTTLVGTTENLKDANVQIRQAIQSNASLRIYILFFLLIMSFSLLFLDWYND